MDSNKHILFISCWNPSAENPKNGIFIQRHADAIVAQGYELTFLAVNIQASKHIFRFVISESNESGVSRIEVTINSIFWKFIYVFYPLLKIILSKYLLRNLQDKSWDVVIGNVAHPAGVISRYVAKRLHIPYIIVEHFSKTKFLIHHPIMGRSIKKVYQEAANVVTVSDFLKKSITNELQNIPVAIIPNVISDRFSYNANTQEQRSTIHFVAIANWHQTKRVVKRPDLIMDSLHLVQCEKPDLQLRITFIGGGNMLAGMQRQCEVLNINATFTGPQDEGQITEILNDSDYFLHASTIETFSVVIAEALACGLPTVASNVGAIPELINATNGVLTENTPQRWKEAILIAVNKKYDRQLIANAAQNRFDQQTIGRKFKAIIDQL